MQRKLCSAVLLLLVASLAAAAWGQAYPSRPVRIVVPAGMDELRIHAEMVRTAGLKPE